MRKKIESALGFLLEQRVHVITANELEEHEMTQTSTPKASASKAAQQLEKLLESIALDHLFIDTLATRNSDGLDFHDVSVWGVKSALMAAYQAGLTAGQNAATTAADQPTNQQAA